MCEPYCEKNDAFFAVMDLLDNNSTNFDVTYPTTYILGHQILLANNFYGVVTEKSSRKMSAFTSVMIRLYLTNNELQPMIDFEEQLTQLIYDSGRYNLLSGHVGSDNIVEKEVKKLGTSTAPYLGLSLILLCGFLMICSLRYRHSEVKPLEACLGAFIPVLSAITTVGMVSITGLAFQSIIVSTLFLVLAIGIDDVFVILSAWHRTDHNLDIPQRVALAIQEAGCSMTVTTVTNLVSFGNGVLSTTPVLQTFAIYSSVASVVCFVYQLIIFPAIIAITASREYENEKNERYFEFIKHLSIWADRQWHKLASCIGTYWMRILVISILLGYWYLSAFGVITMKTDLSIQKMANKDSRIVKFKNEADEILKEMQTVAVLVTAPRDLRNSKNLQILKTLVEAFETTSHSYGKESTISWLQPYLDFLSFYEDVDVEEDREETRKQILNFTYVDLPSFLKSEPQFRPMLRLNISECDQNRPGCVKSFIFTTGFTGLVKYQDMYPLLDEWRKITKLPNFESLQVYPYSERNNFVDQTNDMVENIWQTVLSEVVCMAISFVLFVPDTVSIISAVFSLISVNMGVFGFLSIWDVGMDPVSTASLLMSIGFSVDISAHISYHYYQVDQPTPRQKLEHAYTHIGWPTLQGGLSTMLAMMPILLCPSYLGMVFLKTVILVCIFGLLHGLIVLPVFLSLFSDIAVMCKRRKSVPDSESKSSTDTSPNASFRQLPHTICIKG
uniref:SSD domain-containing protein n=2 Tax=Caenorhabditis japonica TaxID=281687 RepID=A0A8R1HZW7_CAEJA